MPVKPAVRAVLAVIVMATTAPAQAHSWYPLECCAGHDCHKADNVTELPDGSAQVQVGNDTLIVPKTQKRLTSPDANYHVCYRKGSNTTIIHCFFQPAQV